MNAVLTPSLSTSRAAAPQLRGLADLMTRAFHAEDLRPLAQTFIDRAVADDRDANALMDLSTILFMQQNKALGLQTQAQALQTQRLYTLLPAGATTLRVLALMVPGDLMANTPLPFLTQPVGVRLEMFYLTSGSAMPVRAALPPHDLLYVAISESDANREVLDALDRLLRDWTVPVINRPDRIARTSREEAFVLLAGAPGIRMPKTARVSRDELEAIGQGKRPLGDWLESEALPIIARPVDSHAGHGLQKIDAIDALGPYLATQDSAEFYISQFVDYRDADGLYRKYRVALIDGKPYAGHMAISSHWMIHYLNAGMTDDAAKRREEEVFMRDFDTAFARRHGTALAAIQARIGLDYLVIDCGETADGELLVFEIDPSAVLHAMDPVDLFPYKRTQMSKVFAAFRALLDAAIARGGRPCTP